MRLSVPAQPGPAATNFVELLEDAVGHRGHAPAVTVVGPDGRQEQGVASLGQWCAKGAHMLVDEWQLEAGDTLGLAAPLSWTTAAVCLAAWWVGIAVDLDGGAGAAIHVVRGPSNDDERHVLVVGDGIDGAPTVGTVHEAWTHAAQPFPDQRPAPRAASFALRHGGRDVAMDELLGLAADQGSGVAGIDARRGASLEGVVAVALRPLVVGKNTVVLDGVGHEAVEAERINVWL